jgi:hypothetical protein
MLSLGTRFGLPSSVGDPVRVGQGRGSGLLKGAALEAASDFVQKCKLLKRKELSFMEDG